MATSNDDRKASEPSLDAIFKELTWTGGALTRVLGLPRIKDEPLQQEFQWPLQRRLDRLYLLEDETLLNIEHQSRLDDLKGLAHRMAVYRLMVRAKFPGKSFDRQSSTRRPTEVAGGRLLPSSGSMM